MEDVMERYEGGAATIKRIMDVMDRSNDSLRNSIRDFEDFVIGIGVSPKHHWAIIGSPGVKRGSPNLRAVAPVDRTADFRAATFLCRADRLYCIDAEQGR
jgi:hypothetical protein